MFWRNFKFDIASGIVVFLVAIPLCLGIALASGAPLFSGLIAGIIGGIVVGTISQSSISVSGPAAGMVAVVLAAIAQLGGFEGLLLATVIAGVIQIVIGSLRAGFVADYIPSNVIQGLLAAIGILIIIKQIPLAFGYDKQAETLMSSLKAAQESLTLSPFTHLFSHIDYGATLITLVSLGILISWPKIPVKLIRSIPAPVVVVLLGVIINEIYINIWPSMTLMNTQLVNIPAPESFDAFIKQFQLPNFSMWLNPDIYLYAVMIAAVASLETLLNLEGAEKLDKQRRYASRNRELVAQGVGNTLSGLIGGLPITSVIVRSSVNVQAGARSKFSTIIHGFLLLITVATIPEWLNLIPLASLAAILIHTGYKLSRVSLYKKMYNEGFEHFFPFIVTILAIVFTNLLLGIIIGLIVSFFFILKYSSQTRFDIIDEVHPSGDVMRLVLPQQVTFLNKAAFISELRSIPNNSNLVIDARNSSYIDYDILELIEEFKESKAPRKNISLNLHGFKEHYDVHDHIEFLNVTTTSVQNSLTVEHIITILKEGNKRFLNNQLIHRHYDELVEATANGQHPMAAVLGCIDSRVPVELVFDVGVGDIFSARVAGNVVNDDILGSLEFATKVAGSKVIIVMGHTSCGAIKAACDAVDMGHVTSLVKKIQPVIAEENTVKENRSGDNEAFVDKVVALNIDYVKKELYQQSEIIRELVDTKKIAIIGALYDVKTGHVKFEELA